MCTEVTNFNITFQSITNLIFDYYSHHYNINEYIGNICCCFDVFKLSIVWGIFLGESKP